MISNFEIKCRVWIEKDGVHVIGKGGAQILKALEEYRSLSKAARALGMSYRFAWMYINKIEKATGIKVVNRERGGKEGGRMVLTEEGRKLLRLYEEAEETCRGAVEKLSKRI
ncbi:MAG: ModE family transcriptional regulator [Archaeoglobus sp.]|jgi:molybdate transport system regulatory protein|nr:MAG: ModE family transcriptional regulator [Archaeoglobus sp.]